MSFGDVVRRWFRQERDEAADLVAETQRRLDTELSRREAELEASPEQRIDLLRGEMAANDAEIESIRRRAGGGTPDEGPGPR